MEATVTFNTLQDAEDFITTVTRAQSMVLAAILRTMMTSGSLSETDLRESLDATEQAALQRRTRETPAVTGLVEILRNDLGLSSETDRGN